MPEVKPLILIVEDDRDLAHLNARLLRRQGYNTLIACSAAEAWNHLKDNTVDLFVLDIELPDGSGLSLCTEFRQKSDAPVLFLTGKSETADKVSGLGAGGDYYLTKPYDKIEFLAVIRSLLSRVARTREKLTDASVIVRGPLTLRLDERKVYLNGNDAKLSSKEFSILLLLVQNEEKELSYESIYESVWAADMNNDSRALRQHVSRMKRKLCEETESFSIFNKHGRGYVFTLY